MIWKTPYGKVGTFRLIFLWIFVSQLNFLVRGMGNISYQGPPYFQRWLRIMVSSPTEHFFMRTVWVTGGKPRILVFWSLRPLRWMPPWMICCRPFAVFVSPIQPRYVNVYVTMCCFLSLSITSTLLVEQTHMAFLFFYGLHSITKTKHRVFSYRLQPTFAGSYWTAPCTWLRYPEFMNWARLHSVIRSD